MSIWQTKTRLILDSKKYLFARRPARLRRSFIQSLQNMTLWTTWCPWVVIDWWSNLRSSWPLHEKGISFSILQAVPVIWEEKLPNYPVLFGPTLSPIMFHIPRENWRSRNPWFSLPPGSCRRAQGYPEVWNSILRWFFSPGNWQWPLIPPSLPNIDPYRENTWRATPEKKLGYGSIVYPHLYPLPCLSMNCRVSSCFSK